MSVWYTPLSPTVSSSLETNEEELLPPICLPSTSALPCPLTSLPSDLTALSHAWELPPPLGPGVRVSRQKGGPRHFCLSPMSGKADLVPRAEVLTRLCAMGPSCLCNLISYIPPCPHSPPYKQSCSGMNICSHRFPCGADSRTPSTSQGLNYVYP